MFPVVAPAAKFKVPEGSTPPTKSFAEAALAPMPATDQPIDRGSAVAPDLVAVKTNAVVPDNPSALVTEVVLSETTPPVTARMFVPPVPSGVATKLPFVTPGMTRLRLCEPPSWRTPLE